MILLALAGSLPTAAASPAPPGAPVGLLALPGADGTVVLSWQPPLEDGGSPILEYRVYRAFLSPTIVSGAGACVVSPPFALLDGACWVGDSTQTTFVDEVAGSYSNPALGYSTGSVQVYEVRAVNAAGEGPPATVVFFRHGACIDMIPEPPFVGIDPDCILIRSVQWA